MTNAEFEQIIAEHAKWLANKDQGRPAYVRGQDLTRCRFCKVYMPKADLVGCKLTRVYLAEATLSNGQLYGSDMREVQLHKTNLSGANMAKVDLSDAACIETDFSNTTLTGANFTRTLLNDLILDHKEPNWNPGTIKLVSRRLPGGMYLLPNGLVHWNTEAKTVAEWYLSYELYADKWRLNTLDLKESLLEAMKLVIERKAISNEQ